MLPKQIQIPIPESGASAIVDSRTNHGGRSGGWAETRDRIGEQGKQLLHYNLTLLPVV